MARILVLGGAGFIGYHLASRLCESSGHALTLVDDFSRGRMDPELAALVTRRGVELVKADLTDPTALATLSSEWDQIYLLAAVVGVRNVTVDPARVIRVNTLATLNVLEWLRPSSGVIFFASTSETYAGGVSLGQVPVPTPESVALSIESIENPRFAYAASKIVGEAATIHAARAKGVPWVVARFHNVYGPRMGADHVISELCLRALDREDPFRVYGAEQRRAFCHVSDAVDAMIRLTTTARAWGHVVNVGDDRAEISVGDLVDLVLRTADFAPALELRPAPPGSVARRSPDLGRLRALTGFEPRVSLATGVRETFEWYRARHATSSADSGGATLSGGGSAWGSGPWGPGPSNGPGTKTAPRRGGLGGPLRQA